jgi:hypothetical protein
VIALAIAGLIRGKRRDDHFRITSKRTHRILRALGVPPHTICGVRRCAEHRSDDRAATIEARARRDEAKRELENASKNVNHTLLDAWNMPDSKVRKLLERQGAAREAARKPRSAARRTLASDKRGKC